MPIFLLGKESVFPSADLAHPSGAVAVGGDLSVERLLAAYRQGVFPWYDDSSPAVLWWSPDPRFVLFPERLKVSKSMRRVLKSGRFRVTYDTAFRATIRACQRAPRQDDPGTWITADMLEAYCQLHDNGYAHSVEVWSGDELAGGLYGVSLGRCFFGESMFAGVPNASKVGLITLVRQLLKWEFAIVDCQVETAHLGTLGAELIPRPQFLQVMAPALQYDDRRGRWTDAVTPGAQQT